MWEIKPYYKEKKFEWDEFVASSRNSTFLFKRDYMEYHSDRFPDYSFLIYRKGKLYCLLPATQKGDVVSSHAGLTYGGLVMNNKCAAQGILDVFEVLIPYFRSKGVRKFIYKPVPYIYSTLPAEEDLYALFRHNAKLEVRNISSTILRKQRIEFTKLRRRSLKKAIERDIRVSRSNGIEDFYRILSDNLLQKYSTKPVHSVKELRLLKERFPENIVLFGAFKEERMIGGVLCYVTKTVVHSQYISANDEGKANGALDLIFQHILDHEFPDKEYFDFGTSCEDDGRYLNESLIYQKEGFGGRGVCYDTWIINL